MPRTSQLACLLAMSVLFTVSGCGGSSLKLLDLHGKVTFAGTPVKYGVIEFVADSNEGQSGPAGSAEIVDGTYSTSQTGRGVVPGAYLVRITALEERPQPGSEDETQVTESKPPIVDGYEVPAKLEKSENNFDVPESARGFNRLNQNAKRRFANEP